MMTTRNTARLMMSFGALLAISAAGPDCRADSVFFDGSTSSDFHVAANWTPDTVPGANLDDILSIDDGLSSTFSGGSTTVGFLRVGTVDKSHTSGETHFGRLLMTGGTLEVIGNNTLAVGRENLNHYPLPLSGDYNQDSVVDGADFLIWQQDLGSMTDLAADGDESGTVDAPDLGVWKDGFGDIVYGGEIIMTGSSTLRAYGALIGERTKGLLSIGPSAVVDIRIWDTSVEPNQFGGTEDMRVGTWGPAYETFGGEPGLNGNGLVDVQGTLNAKDLYLSEHGAKGEIRLSGGAVNLNGELIMDLCDNCVTDPGLLALRSSKVSIVGSSGTFNVGLDPDPLVVDTMPPPRNLRAADPTAKFSFTADAGGVTPITVVDNPGETSGFANINTAKLELNLDAYTSTSPLTLIDAPPGQLSGAFGMVTFLGSRTAAVNYDLTNGDVFLNNFQSAATSGSATAGAAPEPSSLLLALVASGVLASRRKKRCKKQRHEPWSGRNAPGRFLDRTPKVKDVLP